MSSSARAVRFGRPPGIFLLMKWMTCSLIGALPTVAGGALVCARAASLSRSCTKRWALKPTSTIARRISRIDCGFVAFRKAIAAALPGRKLFCPILRSRLRMFIDTSPKSIFTGHGDSHLWQTVQWSATSSNSSQWRIATPRRVCSS